jgi:hypothetical protein
MGRGGIAALLRGLLLSPVLGQRLRVRRFDKPSPEYQSEQSIRSDPSKKNRTALVRRPSGESPSFLQKRPEGTEGTGVGGLPPSG